MSKANDIADIMASRLNSMADLSTVKTLVDRQKSIASEIANLVGKISGCCIVILYTGLKNPDKRMSGKPVVSRSYSVTVYGRPILQGTGSVPADEAAELAARRLHNWIPDSGDGFAEIDVTAVSFQPDKNYLVYVLDVTVTAAL